MGKTNPFDGCEWIRMCNTHKERYGEWTLAQQCSAPGCSRLRSDAVVKGTLSKMRTYHMGSTSQALGSERDGEKELQEQSNPTEIRGEHRPDGMAALNRVVKLQKRANVRQKTPKRKKRPESEGKKEGTRSNSRDSAISRGSSAKTKEESIDTRLSPDHYAQDVETRERGKEKPRRGSTGREYSVTTQRTDCRLSW